MKYVLDSSVAFKWAVPETDSDKAIRLRDNFRVAADELLAPDILLPELGHSLTRAERQKRIPVGSALTLLADVLSTAPHLHATGPLLLRACELSSKERVGMYDCLYVALAEHEGCELVTADNRLVRTLAPRFPFIIALASLP